MADDLFSQQDERVEIERELAEAEAELAALKKEVNAVKSYLAPYCRHIWRYHGDLQTCDHLCKITLPRLK